MQTYAKFIPTPFDRAGAFLSERQDWLVVPCGRNRDSGPLEESNFHVALEHLGGESDDVEVHRFGHWGVGWFEILLVRPDSHTARLAEEIESALAEYGVLDETDFSQRETECAAESWQALNLRDRITQCKRDGVSIFAARRDELPQGIDIPYLAE